MVASFEQKFPSLAGSLSTELAFFRITPTQLQFIDNSVRRPAATRAGIAYHRDLVYSIFHDLPQQEVETVEAQLRTVEFAEGDVIVRQGAPADKFFIIVDGEVEVVRGVGGEDAARSGRSAAGSSSARSRSSATRRASPPSARSSRRRSSRWSATSSAALVAQSMGTTGDFDRVIRQRLEERGHTIVG